MKTNIILQGDALEKLKELPNNSIDAIITDPPYGLEFMGKDWDKFKVKEGRDELKPTGKRDFRFDGRDNIGGRLSKRATNPIPKKNPRCRKCFKLKFDHDKYKCHCETPNWDLRITEYMNLMQEFCRSWATECVRVLKPGGFLLSFGGTRTYHRLVCGIEDAGFEIRDTIMWLYGSGFPKSLNIGKQIDKIGAKDISWFGKWLREWREKNNITQREIAKLFPSKSGGLTGCVANWELGLNIPTPEQFTKICKTFDLPFESIEEAEREVVGNYKQTIVGFNDRKGKGGMVDITTPATPEAKEWEGWGTALKPAVEPIVVARKPLSEKNVALNVLKWGTGGINIDACRIGTIDNLGGGTYSKGERRKVGGVWGENLGFTRGNTGKFIQPQGRFPANIILDEEAGKMLDNQTPLTGTFAPVKSGQQEWGGEIYHKFKTSGDDGKTFYGRGLQGASRFFYCAKASKSERNFGCEELDETTTDDGRETVSNRPHQRGATQRKNNHPTVKPIKLMEYLIKLVTKENAVVLDPFGGSGTTMIACLKLNRKCILIEKEEEYVKIAKVRVKPFLEQEKLI